jgi:mannose-1-phosphate guanylyltransferase
MGGGGNEMNALILLGGLGSRLRPLTLSCPKPLLPILNKPLISYQIDLLKKFGVRRVVLALGHKAAHFKRQLGSGKAWGVQFVYSQEKEPLGTGGAIRHALPHIKGPAIVLNGDVLSDFNLGRMAALHRRKNADATLALVEVVDPSAFGLVETAKTGRIQRFLEKPSGDSFPVRTVNAGCYLFEPRVVERIPAGKNVSIEREIFPALLSEGFRVESFLHSGYWSDIGTLKTYWRTHQEMHEQKQWPSGFRRRGGLFFYPGAHVDGSVRVFGTAVVGAGTRIDRSVTLEGKNTIGENVRIAEGSHIQDTVILDGARIGPRTRVERSIVGVEASVGADCRVGPDQVLADGAQLPDYSRIIRGLTEK